MDEFFGKRGGGVKADTGFQLQDEATKGRAGKKGKRAAEASPEAQFRAWQEITGNGREWPEARIVAQPVRRPDRPSVLVRRRLGMLTNIVPGFLRFNKSEYLRSYLAAAHGAGYELVYGLVNAVEHMVPQYRCRFICMGTRRDLAEIDGLLASLPAPICFGPRDLETLNRLEEPGVILTPEDAQMVRRLRRPAGVRYFPGRPVLVPPDPVGQNGSRSQTFHDFYDRVEREEPDRIVRGPRDAAAEEISGVA